MSQGSDSREAGMRRAMEQFISSMQAAAKVIQEVPDISPEERADGYFVLTGLLHMIAEFSMVNSDLDHPYFMRPEDRFTKEGLDNPDNLYGHARISDQGEYRITGTRGTAVDLSFQVLAGTPGADGTFGRIVDTIDLHRLAINPDGTYEIIVSARPQAGNWLKSAPGASLVMVRQSLSDWEREVAGGVHIERIGYEGVPAQRATPEQMAARIEESGALILAKTRCWVDWAATWSKTSPVNAMSAPAPTQGGLVGQYTSWGQFQLSGDEALVIGVKPATARYQGFHLGDLYWGNSFDYRDRQTSLSGGQARLGGDGIYHFVISQEDPAIPNWLDTTGFPRGFLLLRWQGLLGDPPAQPTAKVIKVANVRGELPMEPMVSAPQRRAQLIIRARAVDRRFGQ
jgi:hypothetical protein